MLEGKHACVVVIVVDLVAWFMVSLQYRKYNFVVPLGGSQ